jgi:DnaK suppressor protein
MPAASGHGNMAASHVYRRFQEFAMTSHLTAGQRALLEAALVQRQHQLDRQLAGELSGASRVEHAREVLEQDTGDRVRHGDDRDVDLARSDKDLRELGAVCEAQRRLQGSGYGLCADCDAPIPFDRLRLEPWALRCVACESSRDAVAAGPRRGAR